MTADVPRFSPGESVVWRSVWRHIGVAGTVWAGTVVADTPELVALYRPPGAPGRQRSGERGGPGGRLLVKWDGGYRDLVWGRVRVLILHRPGDMYSVWRAWDPETGTFKWRYINLEESWQRTAIGFDSKDLLLDLWSEPDDDRWQWKDEDEAEWGASHGNITREQLTAARSAGELAVRRITAREAPHDRDWDSWQPDPSWPVPLLHEAWRTTPV